jgi:uncharacterized protein YndB with AHSA1/START domain
MVVKAMKKKIELGELSGVAKLGSDGHWTLVFVRVLRHPPARVWDALTDPAQLREWSPFTADRNLATTGPAVVSMVDGDVSEDSDSVVTHADPPRLLEYSWGDDILRWELESEGAGTRLTLRHSISDATYLSRVAAGWHICLVVAEYLMDGAPVGPIVGERALEYGWQELNDRYTERLQVPNTGWPRST